VLKAVVAKKWAKLGDLHKRLAKAKSSLADAESAQLK